MHSWQLCYFRVGELTWLGMVWTGDFKTCCSVAKSCLTLTLHGLQHARLPCSSQSPRVCSNSCPLSQWCYLTISFSATPSPFAFTLSSIRVFSTESALHIRWPKYWSFSISPSNDYSGLISFRMDWWDLLAFQGILKNLLQHHISKHQFFNTQPSLCSLQLNDGSFWQQGCIHVLCN